MQHVTHTYKETLTRVFLSFFAKKKKKKISDYHTAPAPAHSRRVFCAPSGQHCWMWWWWTLRVNQRWRAKVAGAQSLDSSCKIAAGRGSLPRRLSPVGPCSEPDSQTGRCSLGKEQTKGEKAKVDSSQTKQGHTLWFGSFYATFLLLVGVILFMEAKVYC